jgi:hypothetical protein
MLENKMKENGARSERDWLAVLCFYLRYFASVCPLLDGYAVYGAWVSLVEEAVSEQI